jgi:hypothetical protein
LERRADVMTHSIAATTSRIVYNRFPSLHRRLGVEQSECNVGSSF